MTTYETAIFYAQRATLAQYGLRQIGEPTEPITLVEAREHLRVDVFGSPPESADDDWIESNGLPAAREYCEQYLGRALAPRTMEMATTGFPSYAATTPPGASFALPFGPVQSITSITYADSDNVDTVMPTADYELDTYSTPARVLLAYGATWPVALSRQNSVRIRYVAGYESPTVSPNDVPFPRLARAAILLMLTHLYENRAATTEDALFEVPLGVTALLDFLPRERLGIA